MMETYAIEKDVPIPDARPRNPVVSKYPYASMEVGDSFFVECSGDTRRVTRTVVAAVHNYKRRHNEPAYEITTRSVEESGRRGVRVWRVS